MSAQEEFAATLSSELSRSAQEAFQYARRSLIENPRDVFDRSFYLSVLRAVESVKSQTPKLTLDAEYKRGFEDGKKNMQDSLARALLPQTK